MRPRYLNLNSSIAFIFLMTSVVPPSMANPLDSLGGASDELESLIDAAEIDHRESLRDDPEYPSGTLFEDFSTLSEPGSGLQIEFSDYEDDEGYIGTRTRFLVDGKVQSEEIRAKLDSVDYIGDYPDQYVVREKGSLIAKYTYENGVRKTADGQKDRFFSSKLSYGAPDFEDTYISKSHHKLRTETGWQLTKFKDEIRQNLTTGSGSVINTTKIKSKFKYRVVDGILTGHKYGQYSSVMTTLDSDKITFVGESSTYKHTKNPTFSANQTSIVEADKQTRHLVAYHYDGEKDDTWSSENYTKKFVANEVRTTKGNEYHKITKAVAHDKKENSYTSIFRETKGLFNVETRKPIERRYLNLKYKKTVRGRLAESVSAVHVKRKNQTDLNITVKKGNDVEEFEAIESQSNEDSDPQLTFWRYRKNGVDLSGTPDPTQRWNIYLRFSGLMHHVDSRSIIWKRWDDTINNFYTGSGFYYLNIGDSSNLGGVPYSHNTALVY